ncbi:hypothetical protein K469DRAFT_616451 [Zopfia rhizophila CBS 207.26]|uniref:Tho complex subunit 7 mft1p n=1 Tax=Zopfia rhizophila CBS 207.26 TaxID=1314779 RepID=A0A6A6EY33_9PEZI|nr:hypothetical protein K469DRAFT_616451 [Zopfia rhizophila CBS 207.26]
MVKYDYGLLPQADEDAIHNVSRLLSVESRPYQRVSGRLLKPDALINTRRRQLPTPPPDASAVDEEAAAKAAERQKEDEIWQSWQNEVLLDIGLLDNSILRMEMTSNSNHTERGRYATEKIRIVDNAQSIRDNIEELRVQLEEAKETLALRKTYDEQTEKITSSKVLKPRDEQAVAHAKLDEEIGELQQEVENFKQTWTERRIQFGRILEEGRQMLRMIKDEKEEAERKEGMMKDGDDENDGEGSTTRGEVSHVGTPRLDAGGSTPIHVSQGEEGSTTLKVPQDRLAPISRATSTAPSPAKSGQEDTEMADSGDAQAEESSGIEEGEEEEDDGPPPEQMDMS